MVPLTFFYCWSSVPDALIGCFMRELAANGTERIVIGDVWSERIIREPRLFTTLDTSARRFGLKLFEAHAPFGSAYDLNCSESSRRAGMIADQILAMGYAADVGSKTYVIHIGAYDCYYRNEISLQKMRDLASASLEILIPEAEKRGLILAIENSFELSNSTDEVLYFAEKFKHPALGVCFDTGHANFMAPEKTFDPNRYSPGMHMAWRGQPVEEPAALEKLLPHIVTAHLHDNSGRGDDHNLPGRGTINWEKLMPALKSAPRLVSLQSEVSPIRNDISIVELCRTMNRIVEL